MIDADGLDKTDLHNKVSEEPKQAVTPQLLSNHPEEGKAGGEQRQVAPSVPFLQWTIIEIHFLFFLLIL